MSVWDHRARSREETRRLQAAAADPEASVWVSANAGTGKTHVVSMRMLRLLLSGTAPERILALTYTKAAAAEMSKRVFEQLAEWVVAAEDLLPQKLKALLERAPTEAEMRRARQLFAIATETPGGLKVETIHAFCERLLQRFPLEAGVPAGFAILDEQEQAQLIKEAVDAMLAEAAGGGDQELAHSLALAVRYASEANFDLLLGETLRSRDWLAATARDVEEGLELARQAYREALELDEGVAPQGVRHELDHLLSLSDLKRLREALASGSAQDVEIAHRVERILAARDQGARIEALGKLFLTRDGEERRSLLTSALAARFPELARSIERTQQQFLALEAQRLRLLLLEAALALLRLGHAVRRCYAAAKARRAALDFDDLVERAAALLGASAAVDWVLYKLDGGLDHILVDEAQDTSGVQWTLIEALAAEFFAGRGAHERARTLFAVGDEKQSIYGFQGAKPAMFAAMGEAFAARAAKAHLAWRRVPLSVSFRTVEPLLAAIDAIFQSPERTPGLGSEPRALRHIAHRVGQAGLIEIWPTEKHDAARRSEVWAPLAEATSSSPVARLAERIATTIEGWLQSKEMLLSEHRPARAGDILILVRKRAPFVPAMVRALKARGIPVAGADRLRLLDQIAVQDLLALGDFLCLADDDLALAGALKSPLLGLNDDDLLGIAAARPASLWQAVLSNAPTRPRLARAAEALVRWRRRAQERSPFEFFATLLDAERMRAKLAAPLGSESADAIDEFLTLVLAYEEAPGATLQGFLSWFRDGAHEIRRDMQQGRDEVRVMTVHGAKGLEAPIVFLPDTCSTASGRRPGSLLRLDARFAIAGAQALLWPLKGTSRVTAVRSARAAAERADAEERNRLLYVALTRARDRLYIAGFEGAKPPPDDCWYNLVRAGLADRLGEVTTLDGRRVWRLATPQELAGPSSAPCAAPSAAPLPDWVKRPAPAEPLLTIPLVPSRLAPLAPEAANLPRRLGEASFGGLAAFAQEGRFLRGTLIHALLEHLPALPAHLRAEAARGLLARMAARLPRALRQKLVDETLRVLEDATFAPLFGPSSRAEVSIAAVVPRPDGGAPALRLTGTIDRLAVIGERVLIVDYKTNRPAPLEASGIPQAYLLQLAAYRLAVQRIFPAQHVLAALLWTDGPRLMRIDDGELDSAERRLWELRAPSLDA